MSNPVALDEQDTKLIRSCLLYRLGVVEEICKTAFAAGANDMLTRFLKERDGIIVLLAKIEGGA